MTDKGYSMYDLLNELTPEEIVELARHVRPAKRIRWLWSVECGSCGYQSAWYPRFITIAKIAARLHALVFRHPYGRMTISAVDSQTYRKYRSKE